MKDEKGPLERKVTKGPRLRYFTVSPDGAAKVAIGLLHGYADYAERYTHVAELWAGMGIATVAIDMRGHGRAEGPRGHCERFSEYLDDAAELTQLVQERAAGLPAVLVGHSFGGLVAASVAIARPSPWRALALSGPFFGVAAQVPKLKQVAGRLMSRLLPRFSQPTGIPGSALTHDEMRARAYEQDPLVFKGATARWFTETTAAQDRAIARAPSLTMPLYVVIGGADPVVSVARARAFFDAAGSQDKTWDAKEGLRHEVLNELQWKEIAEKMGAWIVGHAG